MSSVGSGTFVYAPDIAAYVDTGVPQSEDNRRKRGDDSIILDLSPDIERASISREISAVSEVTLQVNNKYGKYDRVIPRMSKIVVFLKRIRWVQVFAGYVTSAPYESVVPGPATIIARCTLKRLEHTFWDSGTLEAQALYPMSNFRPKDIWSLDGGAGSAVVSLLHEVGKWRRETIHMQAIPKKFIKHAARMARRMERSITNPELEQAMEILLDSYGYIGGAASGAVAETIPGQGSGNLGVASGVTQGDPAIFAAVAKVVSTLSDAYEVISWERTNSIVYGTKGTVSHHDATRGGKALDIRPQRSRTGGPSGCSAGGDRLDEASMQKNDRLANALERAGFRTVLWKTCTGGNHYDHVHVDHGGEDPPGAGGNPDPDPTDWNFADIAISKYDPLTDAFYGPRAFINDEPLLKSVEEFTRASLREFQSAPNGDFIGFFPDKYGIWGKTPAMRIRDIELIDLNIQISDDYLATHIAGAGETMAPVMGIDPDWVMTPGVVTVEERQVLNLLLGLEPDKRYEVDGLDFGRWIIRKFGMRPVRLPDLTAVRDYKWVFFYVLQRFMEAWTKQFSATMQTTFLPEVYPGMRIELVDHGLQLYVEGVQHECDREAGFTTTINVSSPMKWSKRRGEWVMLPMERRPKKVREDEEYVYVPYENKPLVK